jgi:predicted branched-subunit amino acid permease
MTNIHTRLPSPGWVTRDQRASFLAGVRLGIGPAMAVSVLALTFGAAARDHGWGVALPVAFSLFAFSGTAQFTLLTTLSGGAVVAVLAAALINVRYLMMGLAVNSSMRGGRLSRSMQAQTLTDASFLLAHRGDGSYDIPKLIGVTAPQWVLWVAGTAVGALLAPSPDFVHTYGLDVAFPAFFLILAMDELRASRRVLVIGLTGGVIAGFLLLVTTPGVAMLGATTATLLGLLPNRHSADSPDEEREMTA